VDGSGDVDFTGQNSLNVNGVYDFPAREYSSLQGRWISPDPAGLAAVDSSDPQTWNRYGYVRNSPLNTTDPSGLDDDTGGPLDDCTFNIFCTLFNYFPILTSSFLPDPNPPIDWQTILFGPLDPSLVIFNWTACYNANGTLVPCGDPSAVIYCNDATTPDGAPNPQASGPCANPITQAAIIKLRSSIKEACLNQAFSTPVGKLLQFVSPIQMIPGWGQSPARSTLATAESIATKGTIITGAASAGRPLIQTLSSDGWNLAGPLERLIGWTGTKALSLVKVAGPWVWGGAAGIDILAHAGCGTIARQETGQMSPTPMSGSAP
jgi:RHS repeat-associated protein